MHASPAILAISHMALSWLLEVYPELGGEEIVEGGVEAWIPNGDDLRCLRGSYNVGTGVAPGISD